MGSMEFDIRHSVLDALDDLAYVELEPSVHGRMGLPEVRALVSRQCGDAASSSEPVTA